MRRALPILCLLLAASALAETYVWVGEDGITHITDDPAQVPGADLPRSDAPDVDDLRGLWDSPNDPRMPGADAAPAATRERARIQRLLAGAVADLQRGENARATAALWSVLRMEPANPEAHWHLALLARQRGRYESAEIHLEAFLAAAGDHLDERRASARRRLRGLADERRLADEDAAREGGEWIGLASEHFRVSYDPDLGRASPAYAKTVLRYLDDARAAVGERLGAVPSEPMGVRFYGKATYLEAHRHRFSFQTVGFFDGRIHVVSAAHPAGELRALLFHEYAHAVYREQTGGDRPFWLNEGLAELSERASLSRDGLSRSERSALRARIDAGDWIPLQRLAPGFSGLANQDARAAYLESTAAAAWIEARTDRAARGRILSLLGAGRGADEALATAAGLDTDTVDAGVRDWILEEFPEVDIRPASQ